MVDALDSKSGISNGVRVQVPSPVNENKDQFLSIKEVGLFCSLKSVPIGVLECVPAVIFRSPQSRALILQLLLEQ